MEMSLRALGLAPKSPTMNRDKIKSRRLISSELFGVFVAQIKGVERFGGRHGNCSEGTCGNPVDSESDTLVNPCQHGLPFLRVHGVVILLCCEEIRAVKYRCLHATRVGPSGHLPCANATEILNVKLEVARPWSLGSVPPRGLCFRKQADSDVCLCG